MDRVGIRFRQMDKQTLRGLFDFISDIPLKLTDKGPCALQVLMMKHLKERDLNCSSVLQRT